MSRIERRFAQLKQEGRAGLVIYLMAGDPDPDTSLALFEGVASGTVVQVYQPGYRYKEEILRAAKVVVAA